MKAFSTLLALLIVALTVDATNIHEGRSLTRHARMVNRAPSSTLIAKSTSNRCKNRKIAATSSNASLSPTPTPSPKKSEPVPTPKEDKPKDAPAPAPPKSNNAAGLINVKSNCGNIGASRSTTHTSGPNGNIDWLNCGVNDGGWRPPFLRVGDVVTQSLSVAVKSGSSPFRACSPFIHLFEKYGNQFGLPAIMLASFAMQESSCNPNTVGGGGEQGLMQITKDKCGGAPGGNCRDPEFNIRTGAAYFSTTLNNNGGDLLVSLGTYNGWFKGMTYSDATRAAHSNCCRCQNNLDYLHQFLNGWLQNINAYDRGLRLGKYFNLDVC